MKKVCQSWFARKISSAARRMKSRYFTGLTNDGGARRLADGAQVCFTRCAWPGFGIHTKEPHEVRGFALSSWGLLKFSGAHVWEYAELITEV